MHTSSPATSSRPPRWTVRALALAGLVAACLLVAWPVSAQVTPATTGWAQAQGDAAHSGAVTDAAAPPYTRRWTASVPLAGPGNHYGLSAPVLAGTTAVAVGPTSVQGFDTATGGRAFTVDRAFAPSVPAAVADVDGRTVVVYTEGFSNEGPETSPTPTPTTPAPSPGSTPTPAAGTVDSHLAAFDMRTQRPVFRPVQLDAASKTGVTVAGDVAYVGDTAGTIYAVDLATGKVAWRVSAGGALTTPVAVAGDLVVASVQGEARTPPSVVALHVSDGSLAWRYAGATPGLISGPAVGGNLVFVALTDGTVRAIDLRGGTETWSARLNSPVSPLGGPALADGGVFVVDVNGQLYRLDPTTGERAWDYALNEIVPRGWPVVAGGTVLVATQDGRLVAVDAGSGHLVWQSGTGGGPLRGLTPTADLILAVRGGGGAGLEAYANDPAGALVDLVSPTVADPVVMARNFAVAAVPIAAILIVLGRWLSRRMGPAFIVEDDEETPAPVGEGGDEA